LILNFIKRLNHNARALEALLMKEYLIKNEYDTFTSKTFNIYWIFLCQLSTSNLGRKSSI